MSQEYKRLNRKLEAEGSILTFYRDTIQLPDGREAVWDTVEHKGAAAVVAVNQDGKLLMVRQYRNAVNAYTLEIPAGCVEYGEEALLCASRELEEETGYKCKTICPLITIMPSPGYSSEIIEIFVAKDLVPSKQNLDEDEFLDIESYDCRDLNQMIFNGEIQDSKTIAGIMSYQIMEMETR